MDASGLELVDVLRYRCILLRPELKLLDSVIEAEPAEVETGLEPSDVPQQGPPNL